MTPNELTNAIRQPISGSEFNLLSSAHFKQLIRISETAKQYADHMGNPKDAFDPRKSMAIMTRLRGQLNSLVRIHDPNLKKNSPKNVESVNNYLNRTGEGV